MDRLFRILFGLMCVVGFFLGVIYILQLPFAIAMWPFPAMSPLSFLLLGSLFVTLATTHVWPLFLSDNSSIPGVTLVYVCALPPIAVLGFQRGAPVFAAILLAVALLGVVLLVWSWRFTRRDVRPLPRFVRWSFVLFVITLTLSGGQLVLQRPNILPWNVTPELSILFGWAFLGSMPFFAFALYRPGWSNAGGHLLGFLVYDLILIFPFVQRLPTLSPEQFISMIVYLSVVVFSGLLSIYFLAINPETRLLNKPAKP
jgi:hypothetical protein